MPYYTPAQVEELMQGRQAVLTTARDLQRDLVTRSYRTAEAQEHAKHGLARRMGTLARCVDAVFCLLPPGQTEVPVRDVVVDATINIQAFVFNVFGCCDNIAWMWVLETGMIRKEQVGLASKHFRASCSKAFRDYLTCREDWLKHLKDFRDALAHRIPLFIPPFTIEPAQREAYLRLEAEKNAAIGQGDLALHDQIEEQQRPLEHFQPIMSHSLTDSRFVKFHAQLLADFGTIDEVARKMLIELDQLPKASRGPYP